MYADILRTVTENARVDIVDGVFDAVSLEAEIEFEAGERGLSADEIAEAVAFALDHAETNA